MTEAARFYSALRFVGERVRLYAVFGLFCLSFLPDIFGSIPALIPVTEVAAPFRVQYLVLAALGTVVLAFLKRRLSALILLCTACWNIWHISPYLGPRPAQAAQGIPLRILSANVHLANRDPEPFFQLLRETKPDIALVMELTPAWAERLSELHDEYPVQLLHPETHAFGMGLLAKRELNLRVVRPEGERTVMIEGEVGAVRLLAVHTLPPSAAELTARRNQQLKYVATRAATEPSPLIVAGDLNIPPWSPVFERLFPTDGRLVDSRRGFGLLPTWNSTLVPMMIPIDYVLTTREVQTASFKTARIGGSDHYAVIADLILPPESKP